MGIAMDNDLGSNKQPYENTEMFSSRDLNEAALLLGWHMKVTEQQNPNNIVFNCVCKTSLRTHHHT